MSNPTACTSSNPVEPYYAGRPLRIAVVTETYPPEVNGVAMTVASVVRRLLENGHEVQLVRPRQRESAGAAGGERGFPGFTETLTRGFPIPRYPGLRMGFPAKRRLTTGWDRLRPDVVHIATPGPLGWSALRAAEARGIPTVSEFRTNFHSYCSHYGIGPLRGMVVSHLRRFHNRTARTLVPTARLGHELAAEGFENLAVVARGVDAARFNPVHRSEELRREWGASPETLVVIGVGRLAMEKNLGLLGAAFDRIRSVRPETRLVLVGDGPAREMIRGRCPSAVFAGNRLGADLARHYASADLFLFPSLTETFGNVTIEAMASGLPVLAFDYGAAHELIRSGRNGWVATKGDETAFLRLASEAAGDLDRIRRLGAAAREDARPRGWDSIVRQLEDQYRDALALAAARNPDVIVRPEDTGPQPYFDVPEASVAD
ncbi:MAG: glycosyltransferase family 4 protein [Limisphaerales bacterium]